MKSNKERQKAFRERQKKKGKVRLDGWVTPAEKKKIKELLK